MIGQFRYNGGIPCAILTNLRLNRKTVKVASRIDVDF